MLSDNNSFDKKIIEFAEETKAIDKLENKYLRYYKAFESTNHNIEPVLDEDLEEFEKDWGKAKLNRRKIVIDFLSFIEIDEELPKVVELFNTAKMVNIMNNEAKQLKTIAKTLKKEKK